MKKLLFILALGVVFTSLSCSDSPECKILDCVDDCLFVKVNQTGRMQYISCFETWAIVTDGSEEIVDAGLVPDISDKYKEEDMLVSFSGTYLENDIPLILPDPSFFGYVYRLEVCDVSSDL